MLISGKPGVIIIRFILVVGVCKVSGRLADGHEMAHVSGGIGAPEK